MVLIVVINVSLVSSFHTSACKCSNGKTEDLHLGTMRGPQKESVHRTDPESRTTSPRQHQLVPPEAWKAVLWEQKQVVREPRLSWSLGNRSASFPCTSSGSPRCGISRTASRHLFRRHVEELDGRNDWLDAGFRYRHRGFIAYSSFRLIVAN